MALVASAPGQTSRGDDLEVDGFIANFKIVRRVAKVSAVPATEKSKGRDEEAAHALVTVGACEDMKIDAETGFLGISDVLHYTELICTDDVSTLKKAASAWVKKPTASIIATSLLRRDHGASTFSRTENGSCEIFVHPTQLLGNVEVGANTRTWLVSVAAFTMSYHQLMKAFDQCPRDFSRLDTHVENLQNRVAVLTNESTSQKLVKSALTKVKKPYADYEFTNVAIDAQARLCLLTRADLEVFKYLQKLAIARSLTPDDKATKGKKKGTSTPDGSYDLMSSEMSVEQLCFLQAVAESTGDLWAERSAHTYTIGDQCGAVVVFPSGYLYSIVGAPGVTAQQLMKDRTALSRMESLVPYIPYELSGYVGNISSLAKLEMEHRGKKTLAKMDTDSARNAIVDYAKRLTMFMMTDPLLFSMTKKMSKKASDDSGSVGPVPSPAPQPVKTKAVESEDDEASVTVDE